MYEFRIIKFFNMLKLYKNILSLTLLIFLSMCFQEVSASIYRYVDEDGTITYTDDIEEASEYDYDEYDQLGEPNPDNVVFVYDEDTHMLSIKNLFNSEIVVKVQVSTKENLESDISFDQAYEIPAKSTYELGFFKYNGTETLDLTKTFSIGKLYQGDFSEYFTKHAAELIVPFVGIFKVTQGWKGNFTHKGPKSRYAIDVAMPEGTPIKAVKAGRIIDMKMNSTIGGPNPKYRPYANYIRIIHNDGAMSLYVHLKGNTQQFNLGDEVKQGDIIAFSGNTGYTTGPHLHFVMQSNTKDGVVAIPYKLNNIEPKTGTKLIGY